MSRQLLIWLSELGSRLQNRSWNGVEFEMIFYVCLTEQASWQADKAWERLAECRLVRLTQPAKHRA